MAQRDLRNLVSGIGATLLCATLIAAAAGASPGTPSSDLLPDLDQQTPTALRVANASSGGKPDYVLGFQSAVRNIGSGPLIIKGERTKRSTPTMRAYQVLDSSDGTQRSVRTSSRMRYAISPTHQHWHLLHFDRYELRRAGHGGAVVRDQKTGFCLGDRYRQLGVDVPATRPEPTYVSACGLKHPQLLKVEEGISPGYGDNYVPILEGQSLPLTGLPAGRYVLVHRANPDRSLRESSYTNNAASVLLDLRWDGAMPMLTQLAACPDSAACDTPLQASAAVNFTPSNRAIPEGMVSAIRR